jgi:hypothetical protein
MPAKPRVKSSIPAGARPRIVRRHPSGAKERVDYVLARKVVGYRLYDDAGELIQDCGLRDGRPNGMAYRFDTPGKLLSATPYKNGLEHGLARQWSADGKRLIGGYRMRNGTGLDLWWQESFSDPPLPYLAEVRHLLGGQLHGYEWWVNEDQRSVYEERHWRHGKLHGIEREWTPRGDLRRGFPKFFIDGRRVTKHAYLRAQSKDPTLPRLRGRDDRNARSFPAGIARLTRPKAPGSAGVARSRTPRGPD